MAEMSSQRPARRRRRSPALAGAELIRSLVPTLPNEPGVYRMLDERGEVLYVGKAKSLRKRVPAYAKAQGLSARLQRMVALTRAMEFVTTASEVEALLLEANLIKRYRPPFNIVLRDDKSFPYIFLRTDHEFPLIGKHRGAKRPETEYFGPFASAGAVNDTLNALLKAFPLAQLPRQHLQHPHPALPAVPDQALLGALRRPDRRRGLRPDRRGGARVPVRPVGRGADPPAGRDAARPAASSTSSAPPCCATGSRRWRTSRRARASTPRRSTTPT